MVPRKIKELLGDLVGMAGTNKSNQRALVNRQQKRLLAQWVTLSDISPHISYEVYLEKAPRIGQWLTSTTVAQSQPPKL